MNKTEITMTARGAARVLSARRRPNAVFGDAAFGGVVRGTASTR